MSDLHRLFTSSRTDGPWFEAWIDGLRAELETATERAMTLALGDRALATEVRKPNSRAEFRDRLEGMWRSWIESVSTARDPEALDETWCLALVAGQEDLGLTTQLRMLEALQAAVARLVGDGARLRCLRHLQASQALCIAYRQRSTLAEAAPALLAKALGAVAEESKAAGLEGQTLASDVLDVVHRWCREALSLPPMVAELQFVADFVRRVLARHRAPQRFWSNLLEHLDQVLTRRFARQGRHPLADALGALDAAVCRFAVSGAAAATLADGPRSALADLVLIRVVLDAEPEGPLAEAASMRLCWRRLAELAGSGLEPLRRRWAGALQAQFERAQLDWLDDAVASLAAVVRAHEAHGARAEDLESWAMARGDLLSEGLPGEVVSMAGPMLVELVSAAAEAAAVCGRPTRARRRLRRVMALTLGVDGDLPLWRPHAMIEATLLRPRIDEPALAATFEALQPIFTEVASTLADGRLCRLDWIDGDPNRMEAVGAHRVAGVQKEDVARVLRHLAADLRIHGRRRGPVRTRAWYGRRVLAALPVVDGVSIEGAWRAVAVDLAQTIRPSVSGRASDRDRAAGEQVLVDATGELVELIPGITAAVGLARKATAVVEGLPGGPGAVLPLFLPRLAVSLMATPEPLAGLVGWWNRIVASGALPTADEGAERLAALRAGLAQQHAPAEVAAVMDIVEAVYRETLGVRPPSAERDAPLAPLPDRGPLASKVLGPVPMPEALDCAGRLGALAEAAAAHVGQADAHDAVEAILSSFAPALAARGGDVDEALATLKPRLGALVDRLGAEGALRLMAAVVGCAPQTLPPVEAVAWGAVGGLIEQTTADVILGRALRTHAADAARTMAAGLATMAPTKAEPADAQARCERDLTLLLRALSGHLIESSASRAALELTRFGVSLIAPHVAYGAKVWRLVWLRAERALPPQPHAVQAALMRWTAQFSDAFAGLPAVRQVARDFLASDEPAFSDAPDEERGWRQVVSGLLAAAVTPSDAPISGDALAQRLAVSAPLFGDLPYAEFAEHSRTLRDALGLEGALDSAFAARSTRLLELWSAAEAGDLPQRVHRGLGLLWAQPASAALWDVLVVARGLRHGRVPTAEAADLFVTRCAGSRFPTAEVLDLRLQRVLAALKVDGQIAPRPLERRFFGLLGARPTVEPGPDAPLAFRRLALELALQAEEGTRPARLMSRLAATLELGGAEFEAVVGGIEDAWRHGPLAEPFGRCVATLSGVLLGRTLLSDPDGLATMAVERLRPFGRKAEDATARCARDVGWTLHQTGWVLLGHRPDDLPGWYLDRVARFLPEERTRNAASKLLRAVPGRLGGTLDERGRLVLERRWRAIAETLDADTRMERAS